MLGIRTALVDRHNFSWNEIEPGRLLHWKGTLGKQQFDILNLYQHALSQHNDEQRQQIMRRRQVVWTKLDSTLRALPFRSNVVVLGDFNATLQSFPRVAGMGIHTGGQHLDLKQERNELMSMLDRHRLAALNTWGRRHYTYKHPTGQSQIDYILIRQQLADYMAKGSKPTKAPIAGWRSSGHELVMASIKLNWQPWKHTTAKLDTRSMPQPTLEELNAMLRLPLETLQATMKQHHDVVVPVPAKPSLRQVHQQVLAVWKNLSRDRLRYARTRMSRLFGAWQLALLKQKAQRELRKIARDRKREQTLAILAKAEEAADQHNAREHYKFIRMIAPRKQHRRICLRDTQGQLQTAEQEGLQLKEYTEALFDGPAFHPPPLEPLPLEWFEPREWEESLDSLANHKAVPKEAASVQGWKQNKVAAARILYMISANTICSESPYIPSGWTHVQLAWLPKPNRSSSTPANLRTIGLMGADTKAWLQILKKHANPYVQTKLQDVPQYAYRSQASTADPLLRASQHCQGVRQLLQGCQDDLTARLAGSSQKLLVGGLMASLDLSKAFDMVAHGELYESLIDTGMPTHLAGVLLQIHIRTKLHIVHKGCEHEVSMRRGLRQGCSVAPMIYAAWTCRLSKTLEQKLGQGWPQRHLSIYADDKHSFWTIRHPADLDAARKQLGQIIHTITQFGMIVNSSKSKIVLALKGRAHERMLKTRTRWWNGQKCLIVPYADTCINIPIYDSLEYLGMMLSYGKFEVQAAQHRVKQANVTYNQLQVPFRTNGPLSMAKRIRLYKACVLPSILYGIVSVGYSLEVHKVLNSAICRHLRKICRVHERGVSNQQVLQQAGIDVFAMIEKRMQSQLTAIQLDTQRSPRLTVSELRRAEELWSRMPQVQHVVQSQSNSHILKPVIIEVTHPCPKCGQYFGSVSGLHQHIHRRHPELELQARVNFDRSKHCLYGVPICRFCNHRSSNWQALRKHLSQGMCLAIKTAIAEGRTITDLENEIAQARPSETTAPPQENWIQEEPLAVSDHAMLQIPTHELDTQAVAIRRYTNQCMLCGQRIVNSKHMKTHWRTGHPDAWKMVRAHSEALAGSLSTIVRKPCQFCGSKAKNSQAHSRQCPSFFQVLAVRHLRQLPAPMSTYAYIQPTAPKQDKMQPKYQTYTPPIQAALQGKVETSRKELSAHPAGGSALSTSAGMEQSSHGQRLNIKRDGTIRSFFSPAGTTTTDADANIAQPLPPGCPWLCSLKLVNPHSLCYINAGILAMMHGLEAASLPWGPLQFLYNLAKNAASRGVVLKLVQSHRFRSLVAEWVYNEVQRDTAEYTHQLLQAQAIHNVQWDARRFGMAGLQLRAQGALPIPMPLPQQARNLQNVITHWHMQTDRHALAHPSACVCIQLNRYVYHGQARKIQTTVRFDRPVYIPIFMQHLQVTWCKYETVSAVIHLGRTTQSGHYRALLQAGAQWMFTDDSRVAVPIEMHAALESNVYILWLKRC